MKLGCLAGVEYKNKIIFSPLYSNGIFELDLGNRKVRLVAIASKEKNVQAVYRKAVRHNNEAWFLPQRGEYILCLNLDSYNTKYVKLQYKAKYSESGQYPYYYAYNDGIVVDDKYLICVPSGIDAMMVVDLDNHTSYSVSDVSDPNTDKVYTAFAYDNEIYLLSEKGLLDGRVEIGCETLHKEKHQFNSGLYSSCILVDHLLYLIPQNGNNEIGVFDLLTKDLKCYSVCANNNGLPYNGGMVFDDSILLYPDGGSEIVKLSFKDKSTSFVQYPDEIKRDICEGETIVRAVDSRTRNLASLIYEGYIVEFNDQGEIIDYFNVRKMNENDRDSIVNANINNRDDNSELLSEGKPLSLADYIYLLNC